MRLTRLKRPKALWWHLLHPEGEPIRRPTRIRSRSARMQFAMRDYNRARAAFLLTNPRCQFPGCTAKSGDVHHTRGRIGALLLMRQFWRAVCRKHHDWIAENPRAARELSMLCNEGEWNTIPQPQP
jgi:hypothetical protein